MRSIDPVLLSKIKEQNQTIYNNANPKMSIQVSRAKDTVMDSTYWTVETIRTKEGLSDLSIAARRLKPYGRPDRLYNIYVDNGIVRTATREYPDYQRLKWQNQFDVGAGTAVAIAFDGFWELYRKKWQMVTSEKPWIFWVDTVGKLWCQVWDEEATRTELVAAGVTKVKSIRGWRNINMPLVDQGVVAGYIKTDGKVYYRNYSYQSTGEYAWENERQIVEFTETAVNLNLFITNDYRMGFVIEDSTGKIHLYVTERAWAGMAIAPEKIQAYPYEIKLDLIELDRYKVVTEEYLKAYPYSIDYDLRYAKTDNYFRDIYNEPITIDEIEDWGKVLIFTTQNRLYNINKTDFEIVDSFNRPYNPDEITEIKNSDKEGLYVYRLDFIDFNNFNNVDQVGTLKFKGLSTTNGINVPYEPFEKVFYPQNLEPTEIPLPEVEAIWNE